MTDTDPVLATPPTEERAFELWLQHAAGFVLFEQIRSHARRDIDPALDPVARKAAEKAIDDALYGVMQTIEGIPRPLQNDDYFVEIEVAVSLKKLDGEVVARMNLRDGDGVCMGYHGWLEGDFGSDPITR